MIYDLPKILTAAELQEGKDIQAELKKLERGTSLPSKPEVDEKVDKIKREYLADVSAPGAVEKFERSVMEIRAWQRETANIRIGITQGELKRVQRKRLLPFAISVLERALVAAEQRLAAVTEAETQRVREVCGESFTTNQIVLSAARPRDWIKRQLYQLKTYGVDTYPSRVFLKRLPEMLNGQ